MAKRVKKPSGRGVNCRLNEIVTETKRKPLKKKHVFLLNILENSTRYSRVILKRSEKKTRSKLLIREVVYTG